MRDELSFNSQSQIYLTEADRNELPALADAVIIGGGIMGCSTAWYLAQKGLKVVLLERDQIAFQQSGRNWGFVRTLCRDPLELPLANLALSIWPNLSTLLDQDIGWRRSGCMFLADSDRERSSYEQWLSDSDGLIADTQMLEPAEVQARFPHIRSTNLGAIIAENDGQADPVAATLAVAGAARHAGATLIENCGVQQITTEGGAASGVKSELGTIRSRIVICTAGAKSHQLLKNIIPALPQKTVRSTVALSEPISDLKLPCFVGRGLGLRQRSDGSCLLATDAGADIDITLDSLRASHYFLPELMRNQKNFAITFGKPFFDDLFSRFALPSRRCPPRPRTPEIPVNKQRVKEAQAIFSQIFGRSAPRIVKTWAGNIDVMPDALPVIDASTTVKGLAIATGFSGHGFGLGPAIGKVLAEVCTGSEIAIDLSPFSADRFRRKSFGRPYGSI